MSAVRPEFGPTLPELLGPRVRALPRFVRLALALLGVVVVALLLWAVFLRGSSAPGAVIVVREPMAFNFVHRAPLERTAPGQGELVRVAGRGQAFAVSSLKLPAYRGDAAGFLPVYATQIQTEMARRFPEFMVRLEGRANVNRIQGYELLFQYRRPGGQLAYGRRILLLPTSTARDGVDLLLTATRTPAVARVDAVGRNGALKTSLRSFRFGTERP
jgi:hypothetical protein